MIGNCGEKPMRRIYHSELVFLTLCHVSSEPLLNSLDILINYSSGWSQSGPQSDHPIIQSACWVSL